MDVSRKGAVLSGRMCRWRRCWMSADTCLSMADKTVSAEDRAILQTAITNNKNGSNEVEKWTSETNSIQKEEESSSECSLAEEDWPKGFPLLRMALLGLPRPQLYGTSIQPKPVPSTNTSSANKACETTSEKSSCVEELKPIVFVSVKEEVQDQEDSKTAPDWEDETAEADSLSDTIYPALLCSPDLHSPTSQDSPHLETGGADQEQIWSCGKEVEPHLSGSNVEEDLEQYQFKLTDKNKRKKSSHPRRCQSSQMIEDGVNNCESNDKVIDATCTVSCHSKTCDCSGVFVLHSAQDKLSDTKQFKCTKCGKAFKQLKNLNKHSERLCRKKLRADVGVRKVSTARKRLKCDICDRKFTTNQHLRNHLLTHSGKRPYTCDLCECSFIYKSHVARHRLTHTNERHYVCDYCSYSFIQKSNFHLHLRTMACMPTYTAKFVCDLCYQAFSKKMYLDSHSKKHASVFISTE